MSAWKDNDLFRQAVTYRKTDQFEKAKECITRILEQEPADIKALNEMGKILTKEGAYTKASGYFRRVLQHSPNDPYALTELGAIYRQQGNTKKAIEHLTRALHRNPTFTYAMNELGVIYSRQGNTRRAVDLFKRTLRHDRNSLYALTELGFICNKQGNIGQAIEYFNRALKSDPNNVRVLSQLALLYNQEGETEKANACFRVLIEQLRDSKQLLKKSTEEIKKKNAQLVASGRVTTANAMATCFAHQINNPLNTIQFIIYNLVQDIPEENTALREGLAKIQQHADQIHDLVNHLNKLVKDEEEDNDYLNINEIILTAFQLFEEQFYSRGIKIDTRGVKEASSPLIVYGNSIKLEQVFINLIANARDALESVEDPCIEVETDLGDGNNIVVYFSDNGQGISKENLERVFESLFTTKQGGTGLGLWLCYSIVSQMNGDINVESQLGKGTRFVISLPNRGDDLG
jgi:signal transduction histidine kinase